MGLFYLFVLCSAALWNPASAEDYVISPGGNLSLEECLKKLSFNDSCLLQPGHYYTNQTEGLVTLKRKLQYAGIEALPGGEVVIDGTRELKDLTWKTCAEEDDKLACSDGVFVANLGDQSLSQLFLGSDEVMTRRPLVAARWPNAFPSSVPEGSGLPDWAAGTDTYTSWSYPDGSLSGRMQEKGGVPNLEKRKPGRYAKFVDDGGNPLSISVEVEQDQWDNVTRQGQGFLNESGVSVENATIVIVYGKGSVESGKVYKHSKGSNEFEIEHTNCITEGYGSCGKGFWKTAFVSYFFENKLELLDQPYEYYFQVRQEGGNRLFLKLNATERPADQRFWARHSDYFLNVQGSLNMTVRGIKCFATSFTTDGQNSGFKLEDNVFLFPSAASRTLDPSSRPQRMLLKNAHHAMIKNSVWMYAEGTALEVTGIQATMKDNLFRFNGILSTDGPQTIKWSSKNGIVLHNSLEWNGQVTGWKLMGAGQVISKNRVQHQNWGKTLHDGAGIHVQMSAGASEFSYNWVHDGHKSLGIRFDTSQDAIFTKPEDIGHDAQVHHNVLWGTGTNLAMKGERMNVTSNTLVQGSMFRLIRAFGNQQAMHEITTAQKNALERAPLPRGKVWSGRRRTAGCGEDGECWPGDAGWENTKDIWTNADGEEKTEKRPKGPAWNLPAGVSEDKNFVYKDMCWDGLNDCLHQDFRPKGAIVQGFGAYDDNSSYYWIPGRRGAGPSSPVPEDKAEEVLFNAILGLAFLPAEECKMHDVTLTWEGKKKPWKVMLKDGANLWMPGKLPKSKRISWTVTPVDGELGCKAEAAATWTFTTAKANRTATSTMTTTRATTEAPPYTSPTEAPPYTDETGPTEPTEAPPGLCVDTAPTGVTVENNLEWCKQKVERNNCNIKTAKERCQLTCGHCSVQPTTSVGPTEPTEAPPGLCVDTAPTGVTVENNLKWCKQKVERNTCNIKTAKERCQLTCGHCSVQPMTSFRQLKASAETALLQNSTQQEPLRERKRRRFLSRANSLIQTAVATDSSRMFHKEEDEDSTGMSKEL